jgi:hypothetical protein
MYNLGGRVTNAELIQAACHDIHAHHATLPEVGAALSELIAAYQWQIIRSWVYSKGGLDNGAAWQSPACTLPASTLSTTAIRMIARMDRGRRLLRRTRQHLARWS